MSRNRTLPILIVPLAAALSLLLAVSAFAAQPTPGGAYAGFTSGPAYHGFKPPVSFKVSSDGKLVRGFKWAGNACIGMGGPGDVWTRVGLNYEVGTINVSPSGKFSVGNVKWTAKLPPPIGTKVTISTVNGQFTNAKTATGTITFTQRAMGHTCAPVRVRFTARAQ